MVSVDLKYLGVNIREWVESPANVHGLKLETLRCRLYGGMGWDEAISTPTSTIKKSIEVEGFGGRSMSFYQWSKQPENVYNVSASTLNWRVQHKGETLEQAMSYPPNPKYNRIAKQRHIEPVPPRRCYRVFKSVHLRRAVYRTYWLGNSFSMIGEPLLMTEEEAREVADRERGAEVERMA